LLKREIEVARHFLSEEKKVLKLIEEQYKAAYEAISMRIALMQSEEMTASQVLRLQHQKTLKAQVSAILDKLHADEFSTIEQFTQQSYTDGYIGTVYSLHGQDMPFILPIDHNAAAKAIVTDSKINEGLYTALGVDTKRLKKTITEVLTRGIASNLSYAQMTQQIMNATKSPKKRAKNIVRTEAHRIQQASQEDVRQAAKGRGADVVKQWDATLDMKTRDSHRMLDGQIREVDEPFEIHGLKAMYPGDFGDPAEDCNCRCVALTRARKALDADELQTMQERAAFFKLDKTENFKEFKEKYLKASETLEKSGKSGIMDVEKSTVKNAVTSGAVTTKVNKEKQNRHIKSSAGYQQGKSYITGTLEDAQKLVDELSGKGVALYSRDGKWLHKERVHSSEKIGIHVDPDTGKETKTSNGIIVYSKTGSHIIPAKGDEE